MAPVACASLWLQGISDVFDKGDDNDDCAQDTKDASPVAFVAPFLPQEKV